MVTRFLDGGSEIRFPADERYFLPFKRSDPLWGPPGQSVFGRERPEREIDHSPLSTAEIKNEWRVTSTPAVCLRDVDRINFAVSNLCVFHNICYTRVKT